MNNSLKLFNVSPHLPRELQFLEKLSFNMWWCWHPAAAELFVRINPKLWREVGGNARRFLGMIPQTRFEELARDSDYIRVLKICENEFERKTAEKIPAPTIGYFSMEYGIHESVRLYSGGLGILSGDHLKAASDLKLPLVAAGLLYRQGYFRQLLDRNGWQLERYPENELYYMPITRTRDPEGREITIEIPLADRKLYAAVWTLKVGCINLLLLDTEIGENPPEFREITWRLYGGDKKMRLRQELLLGVGGFKAMIAAGFNPEVCHMNEGHAAFLSLARLEYFIKQRGYDLDTALELVWRSNVFTTHTPVPAGNEVFDINLARPYLEPLCGGIGLNVDRMINWGIPISDRNRTGEMSMTVLGLRLANYSNGVSKLHGEVARNMWKHLWPGRAVDEIPIKHITNGVHIASWVSPRKQELFERYLPPDWCTMPKKPDALFDAVMAIPDDEFWAAHELCRHSLVRRARRMFKGSLNNVTAAGDSVRGNILDPNVLTIGFARRFATYKRGTLLLRWPERLLSLLRDPQRPVQFIFAGKSHPADDGGKRLIQQLIQFAEKNGVSDRLIFLEDYDISLARSLVQGVDVWLNNPKRPQEASGTSGMKAAANGVPNCSILDGWWAEAYNSEVGWAIPSDDNYEDQEDADKLEALELLNIIENEIKPCFYERVNDIPRRWIKYMKHSLAMALIDFSAQRMVGEYDEKFYTPARNAFDALDADNAAYARKIVENKRRLVANFGKTVVEPPTVDGDLDSAHVDDRYKVRTVVTLNGLVPEEIKVETYYGRVDIHNQIIDSHSIPMTMAESLGGDRYAYEAVLTCASPGRFGITVRVSPAGTDWDNSVPGFVCWPK